MVAATIRTEFVVMATRVAKDANDGEEEEPEEVDSAQVQSSNFLSTILTRTMWM